jgi:intracellular sulfur oxidation DsrE/DsrF family protein
MKTLLVLVVVTCLTVSFGRGQSSDAGAAGKASKDSLMHAKKMADSLKFAKLLAIAEYPFIKGGKWSGIIPVADPTEIPDPHQEYKMLFALTEKNPDSLAKDINSGLDEVARVLNLHFASGISAKQLHPVVVMYGPGLEALLTNESYKKIHSIDNPNLKIIKDLENAGARFIACGQAMAFHDTKKEDLLPEVKVSLSAQTVLSNYQLQGFVLYSVKSGN